MMISNHKDNNPSDLGNSLANHHADGERGFFYHTDEGKGEMMKITVEEANRRAQELEARGIHDDDNPYYALQTMNTSVLIAVAEGRVDLNALAETELTARGLQVPTRKFYRSYDRKGNPVRVTVPE